MIPPNIAMLGAQINELSAQLKMGTTWFKKRNIEITDCGQFLLLNQVGTLNHWNILCNGLLFDRKGNIASFPPVKLYNLNDHGVLVNIKDCDLLEKIDGQMICLCFPSRSINFPTIHTTKAINGYSSFARYYMEDGSLEKAMLKIMDLNLLPLATDTKFTLTFQWKDNELYLVHRRYLGTFYEDSETELDALACKMKVKRPWRENGGYDPGKMPRLIVRDRETGERANVVINISRPKLVATAKFKYLIPYWISGNQFQVALQFPNTKEKYVKLEKAIYDRTFAIKLVAKRWSGMSLSKKDLAQSLRTSTVPFWMRKFILGLYTIEQKEWNNVIVGRFKKMAPKKLIKILNLND